MKFILHDRQFDPNAFASVDGFRVECGPRPRSSAWFRIPASMPQRPATCPFARPEMTRFASARDGGFCRRVWRESPACHCPRSSPGKASASGNSAQQQAQVGHPVLALGRAQPHRHVGSQARCPAGDSRPVRHASRPSVPGMQFQRASAAAGLDRRQADDHPLGRLLGQQPHADHDAGRQSAGPPHRRRPATAPAIRRWARSPPSSAGPTIPIMPAFVGLADIWAADVWGAGHLGSQYEPVKGLELAGKFALPDGIEARAAGQIAISFAASSTASSRDLDRTTTHAAARSLHAAGLRHGPVGQGAEGVRPRRREATPRATPTAGTASARRPCSPAGWSRPA